jgi:hypothetical protein
MTMRRQFHLSIFIGAVVLIGTLGCGGGGGGGGENFLVSGLWSVSGTGPPSPNPSDESPAGRVCKAAATGAGNLADTQINVARAGSSVTATEVGSPLAFTGTVNESNQSFTLVSTTQQCQSQGACTVCGAASVDFLNAAGNTADVNITLGLTGNSACPFQCTVSYPTTNGTRS